MENLEDALTVLAAREGLLCSIIRAQKAVDRKGPTLQQRSVARLDALTNVIGHRRYIRSRACPIVAKLPGNCSRFRSNGDAEEVGRERGRHLLERAK
jgi:hypothetical protein